MWSKCENSTAQNQIRTCGELELKQSYMKSRKLDSNTCEEKKGKKNRGKYIYIHIYI